MFFPSGDTVSDLNEWAAAVAPPSWKEGRKSPERASERARERMAARSGERDSSERRRRRRGGKTDDGAEGERCNGRGSDLVGVQCPPPIKSWGPVGCAPIEDEEET